MKSAGAASVSGISVGVGLTFGLFFLLANFSPLVGQESQKAEGTSTQQSNEEAAKREAWRKVITRVRFPKPGCFNASYPSTEWKEVPCSTKPPPLQLPPPGQGAGRVILENVGLGDSNDWAAGVSGLISTAEGEIISVTPGTTETDSLTTESDQFSLQLNSQHFTTPLCNGGNAGCYGWQQFVFANQGGMGLSSQAVAFIQYWLVNWGTTPCPGEAWRQQGSDCIINVANNPTTWGALSASSLSGATVTAHAGQSASDLDNVMVVTASGNAQATATANYLNLNVIWNAAEFNVFGYGYGSTANFSNGTTVVVKTGVNSGVTNPPLCVQESFTGEQNSLNLANKTGTSTLVCCPYGGGSPNIQFIETNARPPQTGICGSTQIVGDTHITTANSVRYDFQSAGEFVSLRDSNGDEIQTRQAPVSTTFIGTDAYDGLTTCVSLNTAVAARVGEHRVTYEPNLSGVPDPRGLQLRIDGVPIALGPYGRDLGNGGRVFKSAIGADLEIDFPDGKTLFVTPTWWDSQSKWYLNVVVTHLGLVSSPGGIAGPIANDSWLPALPSGASLGPMPGPLDDRYATLYSKFADAWRITNTNSLFDYAPGTSTETFTMRDWPPQKAPCVVPNTRPVQPASEAVAEQACRRVWDMHADCVFDVRATGNPGFAQTYLDTQRTLADATTVSLTDDADPSQVGEWVAFTAYVAANSTPAMGFPSGTVQFTVDGSKVGEPIKVDAKGRAMWQTSQLKVGEHRVAASYVPGADTVFLPSASVEKIHVVRRCPCDAGRQ
jgi:Bacterial Ig-like domain (group 3)